MTRRTLLIADGEVNVPGGKLPAAG